MTTAVTTLTSNIRHDVLRGLQEIENISSFEDIERLFLRGVGHSNGTYKSYRSKVKLFYEFTNGLHPLCVKLADIESFYDHRAGKVDRQTACNDVQALKSLFQGVERVVPGYKSILEKDQMPAKLWKKLNKSKNAGTKKALTKAEVRRVYEFLKQGESEREIEDLAIFEILYSTGLRAQELCQTTWGDIEFDEDEKTYYFNGIGKGGKAYHQECVDPGAVKAAERYFKKAHRRKPRPGDRVFWTVPAYRGDVRRPLEYHPLYIRIVNIGKALRAAGIITRNIEFSPHLLRRSIITNLSKAGMRVKALQGFSRHSSTDTLLKHYVDDEEPAKGYFSLELEKGVSS
jgi:integrase